MTKICKDCAHSYTVPEVGTYRRCLKAEADSRSDGSLCGEMRKNACGPSAVLFEKKP